MGRKLVGLGFGVAFGFWLGWTRFMDYDVIVDTLLFRTWYLWALFAGAVVANGVGLWLLQRLQARTLVSREPVLWTIPRPGREHAIGGVLFGTGWALAGTCPGPAVAQIGAGRLSGLFTAAGILAGVVALGVIRERRARRAERAALAEAAAAPSM